MKTPLPFQSLQCSMAVPQWHGPALPQSRAGRRWWCTSSPPLPAQLLPPSSRAARGLWGLEVPPCRLRAAGGIEGAEGSLLSRPSGHSLCKRPLLQTHLNSCSPGVSQLAGNPISQGFMYLFFLNFPNFPFLCINIWPQPNHKLKYPLKCIQDYFSLAVRLFLKWQSLYVYLHGLQISQALLKAGFYWPFYIIKIAYGEPK